MSLQKYNNELNSNANIFSLSNLPSANTTTDSTYSSRSSSPILEGIVEERKFRQLPCK
jgi:hypothetical protein